MRTKNPKLRIVHDRILDDMMAKKEVLSYEDYSELCTRKQFSGQVRYIRDLLNLDTEFFHKSYYTECSGAYRVFY